MHILVNLSSSKAATPLTMRGHQHLRPVKAYKPLRFSARPVLAKQDTPAALHQNLNIRFGERLRELRRERNLTQLRMAVDFGIDRSFISDVERGRKSISLQLLEVIALGMKMDLSELLQGI